MIKAAVKRIDFQFIQPGQTSRGTLHSKPSWFIIISNDGKKGIGECSVIPGLNPEYADGYEQKIQEVVDDINAGAIPNLSDLKDFPSICFGLETALLDLKTEDSGILFPSDFTTGNQGIPINGLIWMGTKAEMQARIREKLDSGFRVLKLKVGALNFDEEISLLKSIRREFSPDDLELRLDANGAFSPRNAMERLNWLSDSNIHSIEQPIRAGQWDEMARLCFDSPIPIALDEELIGNSDTSTKSQLLAHIRPQYIILKPSLIGGLEMSNEWIELAKGQNIGWWATSALESNVGLNAISQWVFTQNTSMVQGLGTGQVFSNNIPSPLQLRGAELYYNPTIRWGEVI
ncbi:MAG: o-succinylbenzoate synthase [Tenuifilaceae bacterium]|jgi:o-succinylbenzoate synthase|nr:o-succinylbenzoate synthase [Tenuifilaceae bacterium]